MKKIIKTFYLGIFAGIAIGIGSFLYTLCNIRGLKILGSLLFSVGLLSVCLLSFFLYTGKIGYIVDSKDKANYLFHLLVGYIGNFIGAFILGHLLRQIFTLFNTSSFLSINKIISSRLVDLGNGGTIFTKTLAASILCGMLVYLAVNFFKSPLKLAYRVIILIFCVFLFVYFGYEHCIANMFYFSYGNVFTLQSIINIVIVTIGNSIGAIALRIITRNKQ